MTALEQITKVYKQIMPGSAVDELTPEMRLSEDLGLDSLKMISLMMNLEQQCSCSFEIGERSFQTVQQFIDSMEHNSVNGNS